MVLRSQSILLLLGLLVVAGCAAERQNIRSTAARSERGQRSKPSVGDRAGDPTSLSGELPTPNAPLHHSMARLLERAGQDGGAEVHYREALELEADNLASQLGLARLLARTGREQEASGWFERACHDHPESGAAQNDLGLCYAQCGRPSDALAPFVRAVVLQPERVLYRNNMARVFVELGSYPEALAQLLAVHEPAVAHYNTGYLLQQSGQSLQAAEQFRKAAEIDPDLEPARKWSEQLAHREALRGRTAAAQPGGRDATGYRQLQ